MPSVVASFALIVTAAAQGGAAPSRVTTTAQLREAIVAARPGARIVVAAGEYEGFSVANVAGSAEKPVVVVGEDPLALPVFRGGIQLSDVAHFELARVAIVGAPANGLNVDDAGSYETPSHHVVLRELTVLDCGGRGNDDGIKLSGVVDFRVERCTVERWGRGGSALDMVGCARGVIDACEFVDREEDAAATGVQAKGGSRDIRIQACRFEHAGQRAVNIGGSTGLAYFRPKPEGFEARDVEVEGCTFVGSLAPIAFVGCDGASVRFNTLVRPRKWCLRILQETVSDDFVACRNGVFADNLIVYESRALASACNVGPNTAPETFEFARNYWFCSDEPARPAPAFPTAELAPAGGADPRLRAAAEGDFELAADSPARAHGATAWPAARRR